MSRDTTVHQTDWSTLFLQHSQTFNQTFNRLSKAHIKSFWYIKTQHTNSQCTIFLVDLPYQTTVETCLYIIDWVKQLWTVLLATTIAVLHAFSPSFAQHLPDRSKHSSDRSHYWHKMIFSWIWIRSQASIPQGEASLVISSSVLLLSWTELFSPLVFRFRLTALAEVWQAAQKPGENNHVKISMCKIHDKQQNECKYEHDIQQWTHFWDQFKSLKPHTVQYLHEAKEMGLMWKSSTQEKWETVNTNIWSISTHLNDRTT